MVDDARAAPLPSARSAGLRRGSARRALAAFLKSTTAISAASLPAALLCAGMVVGSTGAAGAEDVKLLPLQHAESRLWIWVGIDGGAPLPYTFDTGSDQFNAQGTKAGGATKAYLYGDGTYGYLYTPTQVATLTFFSANGAGSSVPLQGKYTIGQINELIYTENPSTSHGPLGGPLEAPAGNPNFVTEFKETTGHDFINPATGLGNYFYDKTARKNISAGKPASDNGTTGGTFGAGSFLGTDGLQSSPLGQSTTSGYIVSANANLDGKATPGCAPCTILNLNPSLRAQYTTFAPWGGPTDQGYLPAFPNNANASNQYNGSYTLQFGAGEYKWTGPVMFDTGVSDHIMLNDAQTIADLKSKFEFKSDGNGGYTAAIPKLTITGGANGEPVTLDNVTVYYQAGADQKPANDGQNGEGGQQKSTLIIGLPFFHDQSVMYDLANQATAYTPYFVSANDFTTGRAGLAITKEMGSQKIVDGRQQGWFGIAGVISGAGAFTVDTDANVRLTNVNTYTGATYINTNAFLSLAGPGSIEQSARVVANGTFDISQRGNYRADWGVTGVPNTASIRSLSGTGTVQLGDRTLVLTAAGDTFSGSIVDTVDSADGDQHGNGGLTVAGGRQTLSGENNFAGMTTVNSGAALLLTPSGSLSDDVTVSGLFGNDGRVGGTAEARWGGVLAGSGRFGSVIVGNGARIAPGAASDPNSIGTMTVAGNFVQQGGSVYDATVGPGGASDLIKVSGRATIDHEAAVNITQQSAGSLSINTRYTLVSANQGVYGTYGLLTGDLYHDSPFVDFALGYDPKAVYLDVNRSSVAFADVGTTFNQKSVAAAADALGAANALYNRLVFQTAAVAQTAFTQLSGEVHASARGALVEDSHFVRDAAIDRIRAAFGDPAVPAMPAVSLGADGLTKGPANRQAFTVWGRGFGAWSRADADGNAARMSHSTGGFLAGADGTVADSWRVGALAGYSRTSFDAKAAGSSGASDNYSVGLFAGTQWGNLGFRSGVAYTWHSLSTSRRVAFAGLAEGLSAKYDGGTFQAFGELGYRVEAAAVSFEPYANLAYVRLSTDGFRESYGTTALASADRASGTAFTTLGLRASSSKIQMGTIVATVYGGIGWRHAYGDVTPEARLAFAGGLPFAVQGAPIARNAALAEAGLDMNVTEAVVLGLSYQGQLSSDAQQHGFNGRLSVQF